MHNKEVSLPTFLTLCEAMCAVAGGVPFVASFPSKG